MFYFSCEVFITKFIAINFLNRFNFTSTEIVDLIKSAQLKTHVTSNFNNMKLTK